VGDCLQKRVAQLVREPAAREPETRKPQSKARPPASFAMRPKSNCDCLCCSRHQRPVETIVTILYESGRILAQANARVKQKILKTGYEDGLVFVADRHFLTRHFY